MSTATINEQSIETNPEAGEPPARKKKNYPRWPVLVLAASAFVAIWGGWVALGEMCGYGVVNLLPGIADFKVNMAISLPLGMEVYAAYALGAWLTTREITTSARSFAKWSAMVSLAVGGAGQISYHLLAAAGVKHAPWQIVVIVACVPVAVLGMASYLAHRLHVPPARLVKAAELAKAAAAVPAAPAPLFTAPVAPASVAVAPVVAAAAAATQPAVASTFLPATAAVTPQSPVPPLGTHAEDADDVIAVEIAEDVEAAEDSADGTITEDDTDVTADAADDDTAYEDSDAQAEEADEADEASTPAARPRTPISEEERKRIVQLAKDGYTDRAISREVRRSRHTVSRIIADAKLEEELLALA